MLFPSIISGWPGHHKTKLVIKELAPSAARPLGRGGGLETEFSQVASGSINQQNPNKLFGHRSSVTCPVGGHTDELESDAP